MTTEASQHRPVLEAFDRAIAREAHNLSRWPELTWQQVHNRVQWEEEQVRAVLAKERARGHSSGGRPWMRTRFPFAESKALIRTLTGHRGSVFACAASPDATLILSAGADWTVTIWDAATGIKRTTLVGHAPLDTSGLVIAPHPVGVNACAISPDGSFVISAGFRELKIWDVATGEERATLLHDNQVRDCAVSPDGSFVVSASQDWTVKVWDATSGEERRTLEGHGGPVTGCAVSPDGSFVVSGSKDGTVKVWDPRAGDEWSTLPGHGTHHERGCAVSPDGSFIVCASHDGALKVWDVDTGEERMTLEAHSMWVRDCSISPDGSFVVSASQDGTLKVWDLATGRQRATLSGHGRPVNSCAVTPDGSFIVSAGSDGTVKIWDAGAKDESRRPRWHAQAVRACAMGSDGSFAVSAGDDGAVRVWDAKTGEERAAMEGHGAPVNACAVAPDGSFIVSASGDVMGQMMRVGQAVVSGSTPHTLRIWPYRRGVPWRLGELLEIPQQELERAYFDNGMSTEAIKHMVASSFLDTKVDGDRNDKNDLKDLYRRAIDRNKRLNHLRGLGAPEIILESEERMLLERVDALIAKATVGEARALEGHSRQINACAISPDGSFVVSASDDKTLKVWDTASGQELRTLRGHTGPVADCAVSPDASSIVSAGGLLVLGGSLEAFDLTIRVWNAVTLEEQATLDLGFPPLACAVSPDGSFIVSGGYGGTIEIRDAATLEKRATLDGHSGSITGFAVSPDGAFVVSACEDGTLEVWDIASGRSVAGMPLPGDVYCVALDPRMPLVVCGDEGGNVYLADLIGIEYGPIIATTIEIDGQRTVRCPECWHLHPIDDAWLGRVIDCPTPTCDLTLRVNPFVVGRPRV
ncbi:MAG: eIF2A-related protein [Actinomycetota bacterium]